MARRRPYDEEALLNAIDSASEAAYGSEQDGTLASERARAIERFMGNNVRPAPKGTSQAVSRDTYDTIGWILPSLIRIFTNSDEICAFDPVGPEDEKQAEQESAAVSHVVQRLNPWFQVCHDWFCDALMTRNAYAFAYWDERVQVETEQYEGQTDEGLSMLLDDGVEVVEHNEYPDPEYKPQPMMGPDGQPQIDPMTGQPAMQPPPMLHDVVIKHTRAEGYPRICVLPPERTIVSHQTTDFTLRHCPYFEYWEMKTLSDLRADGFKVEDDLADDAGDGDTVEDGARNAYGEQAAEDNVAANDPSLRRVRARQIFVRFDADGDGIAELQHVVRVGRKILHRQVVSRIPAACIVPTPLPHRHMGMSIADAVADIEEIKTAILRQGLNNLYQANHPRLVVSDKINLDDLLYAKPNGVIRTLDGALPGEHVMPVGVPNVFPQAMQSLEYMDGVRENRTGTNRYFTGTDSNAINKTASGVAQLTSSSAQRVEHIARICAIGVEELFSIVHEMMLKHGHRAMTMRLRGEWTEVDPSTWKSRADLRINVGMGTGNREQVLAHLNNILIAQEKFAQMGLATPAHLFNTLTEMTKAAGFASADKFFNDPSRNPQQAPPNPEMMKLELEGKRIEQEQEAKQAQSRFQVQAEMLKATTEALRAELEKYKVDQQTAVDILLAQAQAQQAERQAAVEGERFDKQIDAEDRRAHAGLLAKKEEANAPAARAKKSLRNGDPMQDVVASAAQELVQGLRSDQGEHLQALMMQMQSQMGVLSRLAEGLSGEREIVRGPDGRPTGVRLKPAPKLPGA